MKYVAWKEERLVDICRLWNTELGQAFPMRTELFKQNSFEDQNVLLSGSWLAIDESKDQVVGFVVAKRWQEERENLSLGQGIGWIQVLLVDKEYRHKGIGSALLKKAEQAFAEHGVEKILLGRDPFHYFPGIPSEMDEVKAWFEHKGYMDIHRDDHDLLHESIAKDSQLPVFEGVAFRLLDQHEGPKLVEFLRRVFPGRWEYEAAYYVENQGTGREFVILEEQNEIIGFCRINDAQSPFIAQNVYWSPLFATELGGIGPLGIDPAYRKKGYGLAIVQAGIHFLAQRNITNIVIDWTGLVEFYQKMGFEVWKSYHQLQKSLSC